MHAAIIAGFIALAAHVTGAINIVASVLGPVGTIISTTDTVVADSLNLHNYIVVKKAQRAAEKKKVVVR